MVAAAYALWGMLPVYWRFLIKVPATEVWGHRVVWCLVFLLVLIVFTGQWDGLKQESKAVFQSPKRTAGVVVAALMLNVNWFTYIWAVMHNHVIETSLGYYINPLVSVLLGIVFLKERLNRLQIAAFGLALLGVLNLTIHFGSFPWIAVSLAISFGLYGLLKKLVNMTAINGLVMETMIVFLPCLFYLGTLQAGGKAAFLGHSLMVTALLAGAGIVTAVPLLLFAGGTRRLPLAMVGFLQYISPTLTLLLGIFLFRERFSLTHLISFGLIWSGLAVFTLSHRLLKRGDGSLA